MRRLQHNRKQYGFIVSQHILRLQAADNLIKLNYDLEQRVQSRTQALNKANAQLQKLSRIDALTNIANRRVFDETVTTEWRRANRLTLPLSLLILDIDNFKTYNDKLGHAAGDQCLKIIASALSKVERRAGTLFSRYGGEEFVCVLPETGESGARTVAEQLCGAVQAAAVPHEFSKAAKVVTMSLGCLTVAGARDITPDQIIQEADKLLYNSKEAGRNRVTSVTLGE